MTQKFIAAMTGYKATNADMTCKGHKFELGRWYEVPEVKMCEKGFHFCVHPSGVYSYYTSADVRVFRCEAEHILEVPTEAGADFKPVAKRIRLVEEVTPGSKTKSNTGDWNTGDGNTGDGNTGHRNTGNRNTGDWNTGDWNTGDWNTGDRNTGNRNTGFFCTETPSPMFFDRPTNLTWGQACDAVPYVELAVGAKWTPSEQMTDEEKIEYPNHTTIGGFLSAAQMTIQQAFPLAWAKMTQAEKQQWLDLPNFDAEKFLKCTGVDVRKPVKKAKVRLPDGSVAELEVVE